MVDPRFGGGPPVEEGLPAPDYYAEELDQQAQAWTAAITAWLARRDAGREPT
ncbi:hypothetical protein QYF68_23260 [Mycolicibacterium austroafricanum]|uniref:SAM-dependent methyltransferase n=1 Tax=Mycolicibacterium austroafricanum TaxID=39687 RepID=A0ABT8HIZ9_MYCAO|nr:hypothetical protein [Mycolicibacterium austroafricanum]MDN4520711.1 hypothetical protein [Mycolicibacterium austroafricanum]